VEMFDGNLALSMQVSARYDSAVRSMTKHTMRDISLRNIPNFSA
jgi:hypothetical protein